MKLPGVLDIPGAPHLTGVKQCTFQLLISIYMYIAHKDMVFNSLVIHHLIMITRINYYIYYISTKTD